MHEKLVLENINLIYYCLKKLNLYNKLDEYYDIGLIGLVEAVKNYDDSKNVKFSTYAYKCIKNEILAYMRKQNKRKDINNAISLDKVIYSSEKGDDISLIDRIPNDVNIENDLIYLEQIELLYKAITTLNQEELFLLEHRYGLNDKKILTQKELSELTGISQVNVCRNVKRILKKLKEEMGKYEYVCDTTQRI